MDLNEKKKRIAVLIFQRTLISAEYVLGKIAYSEFEMRRALIDNQIHIVKSIPSRTYAE